MRTIGCFFTSIIVWASTEVSRRATPQLVSTIGSDTICPNLFFCRDRPDIKNGIFHEGSSSIIVIDLKLVVSSSTKGQVVPPLFEVKLIKMILKNQFVVSNRYEGEE